MFKDLKSSTYFRCLLGRTHLIWIALYLCLDSLLQHNSWQRGQTLQIVFLFCCVCWKLHLCCGNSLLTLSLFRSCFSPFLCIINFIWQTCKHSQFCLLASHLHHIHRQHNDDATVKNIIANIIIQTPNILSHKKLQFVLGL